MDKNIINENESGVEDLLPKEQREDFVKRGAEQERKDVTEQDTNKIRQELENSHIDNDAKIKASSEADVLLNLGKKEKIEKLLHFAKTKGVIFSVHVAKKMEDPFLLDALHDALVKEGYYKNFLK